jgi:hypothetical protein
LLGEQDFAATGHDSFDANAIVMVTLRQATSNTSLVTNLLHNPLTVHHLQY